MTSYYEIGGQVIEVITEGPDASHPLMTRVMAKKAHKSVIELVDSATPETFDAKKKIKDAHRVYTGGKMVRRGLAIAAALAVADGPLPFGDVAAAAFLTVGGTYMVYTGTKQLLD